jgi:hypothetical protein
MWSHNPKVVFDPIEKMWVMYHIGSGTPNGHPQNCTSTTRSDAVAEHEVPVGPRLRPAVVRTGGTSAAPFQLHYSPSLNGPWQALKVAPSTHTHPHLIHSHTLAITHTRTRTHLHS